MKKTIMLGMWGTSSKVCATCQYWEGIHHLTNCGSRFYPGKFEVDDNNAREMCIKKCMQKAAHSTCSMHEYHYSLQRYLN